LPLALLIHFYPKKQETEGLLSRIVVVRSNIPTPKGLGRRIANQEECRRAIESLDISRDMLKKYGLE